MPIASIRDLVRGECTHCALGAAFFDEHVAVVVHYAGALAASLGADTRAVEAAAWLHDLAAIRDLRDMPEHARLGAELAREMLPRRGFDDITTRNAASAIAAHSQPMALGGGSLEEVCLSQADAIAQIVKPAWWLYFAFTVRRLSFEDGRAWPLRLWQSRWEALIQPARSLVGDRYSTAVALFDR